MIEYILIGVFCLALLSFVWGYIKMIIRNIIYISLIILFIKFALQNKSYRINNIDLKEISKIALRNNGKIIISQFFFQAL
jgi:hypothetical protein